MKSQVALDPIYNAAVARELKKIVSIPHEDISIQLDIASAVFARFERGDPNVYGATKEAMTYCFASIIADIANRVPPDIHLLFHFCYGVANHKHAIEPTDMGDMVAMANALGRNVISFINVAIEPLTGFPHCRGEWGNPLGDVGVSTGVVSLKRTKNVLCRFGLGWAP